MAGFQFSSDMSMKIKTVRRRWRTGLVALLWGIGMSTSAQSLAIASNNVPWWQLYQAIDDPKAHQIMRAGRALLRQQYGEDRQRIRTLRLRLSQPISANSGLKKGFRLASFDDRSNGDVTLYVSTLQPRNTLYGQIAHEVFHTHDPDLYGYYAEGLAGLFSYELFRQLGIHWDRWERYYQQQVHGLYGNSYLLMKDLSQVLGAAKVRNMARFTHSISPMRREIDINAWLRQLSAHQCQQATQLIERYHNALKATEVPASVAHLCQ